MFELNWIELNLAALLMEFIIAFLYLWYFLVGWSLTTLFAKRLHILTYSFSHPHSCISKVHLCIQLHFQPNTMSRNLSDKHTLSPSPSLLPIFPTQTHLHQRYISVCAGASVREEQLQQHLSSDHPLSKMSQDYFGFSFIRNNARDSTNTVALNNAADIVVIVIYFLVVLAVGIWVSSFSWPFFKPFLPVNS